MTFDSYSISIINIVMSLVLKQPACQLVLIFVNQMVMLFSHAGGTIPAVKKTDAGEISRRVEGTGKAK